MRFNMRAISAGRKVILIFLPAFFSLISLAAQPDSWTQKSSLPSIGRGTAVAFSIGTKGYIGAGYNANVSPRALYDFWEYDPSTDSWMQIADFPGGGRSAATGFSLNGKGYLATGQDSGNVKHRDLWQYDPQANNWIHKADLPSAARERNCAVTFVIGSKAYLLCGYDSTYNILDDCWEYDPATDYWLQKASMPVARSSGFAFSIGNYGYAGAGYLTGPLTDFWQFDPVANTWTQKANAGTMGRHDVVAFSLHGHGFLASGFDIISVPHNDVLEYDPVADNWISRGPMPVNGKAMGSSFVLNNHAYIFGGFDLNYAPGTDFYEYADSTTVAGMHESFSEISISVWPNPVVITATIHLETENATEAGIEIFNAEGKLISPSCISRENVNAHSVDFRFTRNDLPAGIYFYALKNAEGKIGCGRIMLN